MAGTAYGVGVGPGDPELVTLKALRIVRACDVVAVPGKKATSSRAYQIVEACLHERELGEKELLALPAPMVDDRALVEAAQRKNARRIERVLDSNKDVAILVLGDPSIYSTFGYMQTALVEDGYRVEVVSGVPSFCAAAARLGMPLVEWDEPLHVIPLAHCDLDRDLSLSLCYGQGHDLGVSGTYVFMKSGGRMGELREFVRACGRELQAVEDCGMSDERVYLCADDVPDRTGYFSVALLR